MDNIKQQLIGDSRYREGITACLGSPLILVALTNYCNFACSYCSTKNNHEPRTNIDLELTKHIIDQCVSNNWRIAFGQTYEPFFHPNIEEIIRYTSEKGILFASATNATAFSPLTFDLPMNLLLSYSATEEDYKHRNSKLSYNKYKKKFLDFISYRMKNNIQGPITIQIADYSIFSNGISYNKHIAEVDAIFQKIVNLVNDLNLCASLDQEDCFLRISQRIPIVLYEYQSTIIQVQSTKILPNSYDAFIETKDASHHWGYCDSCFTMLSIQSSGEVAFCCCDPTAKAIAGKITTETNLKDFWLGEKMSSIRDRFLDFNPLHQFCSQCLANVSEHIKPLLTVANPSLVSSILRDLGVTSDLPWFSFPDSKDEADQHS